MKIIIGKNPDTDFAVIGKSGHDITEELEVKSVRIDACSNNLTKVTLVCYGEAYVESDDVEIEVQE